MSGKCKVRETYEDVIGRLHQKWAPDLPKLHETALDPMKFNPGDIVTVRVELLKRRKSVERLKGAKHEQR